jgi:hypothetical protein
VATLVDAVLSALVVCGQKPNFHSPAGHEIEPWTFITIATTTPISSRHTSVKTMMGPARDRRLST